MSRFSRQSVAQFARTMFPGLMEPIDLLRHVNTWVMPRDVIRRDLKSYVPDERMELHGLDFEIDNQLERLARWTIDYHDLFAALRNDPTINTEHLGRAYIHNGYYPTPDAEVYAALIGDYRPARIIEIGSGYSTRIARRALRTLEHNCTLTAIDPQPRADVVGLADRIINNMVEDVAPQQIVEGERLLLFIDSSHITRSRGDIPYLFNLVVPQLPSGTLVQVHDIYTPYDYPYSYQRRLYTEQYVMQALLAHSSRYRVVLATHLLCREHTSAVRSAISPAIGVNNAYYGASFWFEIV